MKINFRVFIMDINVLSKRPDTVNQELGALNINNLPPLPHMVVREFPMMLTDPMAQQHLQQNGTLGLGEGGSNTNSPSRFASSKYGPRSSRNNHLSGPPNKNSQLNGYPSMDANKFNGSYAANERQDSKNKSNVMVIENERNDTNFTISQKADNSYHQFMSQLGHMAYQKPGNLYYIFTDLQCIKFLK